MFKTYLLLGLAIVAEVIATSSLKSSEGFTRLWPSVVTLLGYTIAIFLLSLTLKTLPTGIHMRSGPASVLSWSPPLAGLVTGKSWTPRQ